MTTGTTDPQERGGEPEHARAIIPDPIALGINVGTKSLGIRLFEAAGSPKGMLPWWVDVATSVNQTAGTMDAAIFLLDLLEEVGNSADPVKRQTKGVGELTNPGGFMYSRCKKFVKSRGGLIPPYRG